jgi:3-oxoacyl-[acyl-carrier-protein] synthase III
VNLPSANPDAIARHLVDRLRRIQQELDWTGAPAADVHAPFSQLIDSMGMVEFLLVLAGDYQITPEDIEQSVENRFTTVWELGKAISRLLQEKNEGGETQTTITSNAESSAGAQRCWLSAVSVRLPQTIQPAVDINRILERPAGWLEEHAGIYERRLWGNEDPLEAAAQAARDCLNKIGIGSGEVNALLVTSEAPPLLVGLASALHCRLSLSSATPALDVGGACTGFLHCLWLAQALLRNASGSEKIVIVCVEAPSKYLKLEPGPAGEAAALFGDGAAACLVTSKPVHALAVPLVDIALGCDGTGGHLLQIQHPGDRYVLTMEGPALAGRAVRAMARAGEDLLAKNGLTLADIHAVTAHGGNGRMPTLLAKHLGVPAERLWSETSRTGNLGSASLPAAWASHGPSRQLTLWTAVGAGLTWGAALTGMRRS